MKMNPSSLAALLLFVFPSAIAQKDTTFMTLSRCIRIAQTKGPLAAIARHSFENKKSSYESFTDSFYPQLSLQGDIPGYYHSISTIILPDGSSVFTPQSQATSSLGLNIVQKISATGGELSISSGLNRIDLFQPSSQYYRSNPLSINYQQPLFQINTQKWDRRAQDLGYQSATRQFAEALEDAAIDATTKFFDLYLASVNFREAFVNLTNNDTLYSISQGRFNVGKIAENDLLQSELAFLNAQTEYESAKTTLKLADQNLKIALDIPSSETVGLLPPESIPSLSIDPAAALTAAQQNRSDMTNFELQQLTAERGVEQARSNLFSATMTANFGYNQSAPLIFDAYHNLLDQRQLSINFTVPLYQWGAGRASVDAALAEQERTESSLGQQRKQFEQEVLYQVSRMNVLQRQVAVAARADTVAQLRFRVAKDRYLIGKIDIPNLFLAESEKDNAFRSHIQTLADYWLTYFKVRRLTLYDFEGKRSLSLEQ